VSAVYLQQFPVIRTTISKKSSFLRTPAFIFCLPWERPCGNHAKRCMNEKTIQCLPNSSQYVPIYLQQFLSYSNRKCKISQFSRTAAHIFVSPGDAPAIITQHVAWMERQLLVKPLAACIHLSSIVSQLFEPQVQNIAVFTYRSPHFCFPWRRPCDYHTICCMDGKTIQCLSNFLQHVSIYLQQFLSYSNRKYRKYCKISQFSRTAAHIFVSPGDAPAIITQYAACTYLCSIVSELYDA